VRNFFISEIAFNFRHLGGFLLAGGTSLSMGIRAAQEQNAKLMEVTFNHKREFNLEQRELKGKVNGVQSR